MKVIARFFWDCGRMGEVEGLFVCEKEDLEKVYDKKIYFGEILGKHSEVYGVVERNDIEILSEDQEFITKFVEIMGDGTISGHNPLDHLPDNEEE